MYQFSNLSSFLSDLKHPHRVQTMGRWVIGGVEAGEAFPILSGSVTADLTSTYLRTCDVTIPVVPIMDQLRPQYIPAAGGGGNSLVTPWGTEIKLYRSIIGESGTVYPMIPLGVFRLYQVNIVDATDGMTVELQGYDRSFTVGIQLWTDTYHITKGTALNTAIKNIISPRFSWNITMNFVPNTATVPALTYGVDSQHNPWTVAWDLARSHGYQLYFGPDGHLIMQPWPNPGGQPIVWTVTGDSSSDMIDVTRTLTTTPLTGNASVLPNHVIVLAESSSNTVSMRADAKITDKNNPLYVNGPYGDVPFIIITNKVSSQAHLQAYANNALQKYTGQDEQITLDCIENPALEVNDVIYLDRAKSNTVGKFFVTAITHALEPETPMTVTCQRAVGYDGYSGYSAG